MLQWLEFDSVGDATRYRNAHGVGGWIFCRDNGTAVLCPRGMTVSPLMMHPLCAGDGVFI